MPSFPRTTRNQKLDKATVAFLTNQPDEAKRLLEAVASADPGDIEAALVLAEFYSRNKDIANAVAALDRALKAKPDQPRASAGAGPGLWKLAQELKQIRMKEADKIADPLEKELALLRSHPR